MASRASLYKSGEKRKSRPKIHKQVQQQHRHHHRSKENSLIYDFRGIGRVIIDDPAQIQLKCVVGEDVTAENRWTYIKKYILEDNINFEDVTPEFLSFLMYKQEILDFPGEEIMVGYIPSETSDQDEFLICLTPKAEAKVKEQVQQREAKMRLKMYNSIYRTRQPWSTLGSEVEIDENVPVRGRGLIKVELVAKYPLMFGTANLKERNVQDSIDGYVEIITPQKFIKPILHSKCIDNCTQVTPMLRTQYAQTDIRVPKNTYTQYDYEFDDVKEFKRSYLDKFGEYIKVHIDTIDEYLFINENFNFYEDDYKKLSGRHDVERRTITMKEYMSFTDNKRCKDKMISAMSWNRHLTGIVALAYAPNTPLWRNTTYPPDEVRETVLGNNPVLIWSFNDGISPKLILETHSEVVHLAFCLHDENILVGGCKNGSVIVWDIKNKLNKVEEQEILTHAQHKYREMLFSRMKWMKNTKDVSFVPITASSAFEITHSGPVNSIKWIHPRYVVDCTGLIVEKNADSSSMQFISTGANGSVLFWDLKQKPVVGIGAYTPMRKSRRLKTRPSALTLDVSPYKRLYRRMRPHYKISVNFPGQTLKIPLMCSSLMTDNLKYVEAISNQKRRFTISERLKFETNIEDNWPFLFRQEIVFGTYMGELISGTWDGYEYSMGDTLTSEQLKINNYGVYHDGPIVRITRHPQMRDVYLTVGGKIVSIWKDSLKGRPFMWRKCACRYTYGDWSKSTASVFRVNREDGAREVWNLDRRSDTYDYLVYYSGKALFHGRTHPFNLRINIMGIADDRGSLRLIYLGGEIIEDNDNKFMNKLTNNNCTRLQELQEWQDYWNKKNEKTILEKKEYAKAELKRKHDEAEAKLLRDQELKADEAANELRRISSLKRPMPGLYKEWAREQWMLREQERMTNILLAMKRVDKDTLIVQQAPLKALQEETERMHNKQRLQMMKADDLFKATIAMLFPDLEKVEKIAEVVSMDEEDQAILNFEAVYEDICPETDQYIAEHPFEFKFKWRDIMDNAKLTKKKDDFMFYKMHSERHLKAKMKRYEEDSSNFDEDIIPDIKEFKSFHVADRYLQK